MRTYVVQRTGWHTSGPVVNTELECVKISAVNATVMDVVGGRVVVAGVNVMVSPGAGVDAFIKYGAGQMRNKNRRTWSCRCRNGPGSCSRICLDSLSSAAAWRPAKISETMRDGHQRSRSGAGGGTKW